MLDEIFDRAVSLIKGGPGNEPALRTACEAAVSELEARLKKEFSPVCLGERFVLAAAMLALALYTQFEDSSGVSSFRAGEVSVSRRGEGFARSASEGLRAAAESMLLDALEDRGFKFRGVIG